MHNEPAYSKLIYEYFVLRFQFQYYKYGDKLPPIETLCRKFGVSPLTVKAALTRLQEEGYVSIQHGKCTPPPPPPPPPPQNNGFDISTALRREFSAHG